MKNVTSSETIANTKILHAFQSIVKKITRTKLPKTRLNHICQLVEFLECEPTFDNLRFKWAKEKKDGTARLHSLELQVYNKSKMAYETLKSRLIDQKLIDLPEIKSIVAEQETLFASNERNCSPLPWQLAFDMFKVRPDIRIFDKCPDARP
jgi:hypothetical protein